MNDILLSHEVIVYLLSEVLLYALLSVAFLVTLGLLKGWDFNSFTSKQFKLENRSYLVMSIISFSILLKVLLLPYFVYTIDNLSDLVPGAMCGAGVIKANSYGNPLLLLKIVILFLSGLWISINKIDLESKNYLYIKLKSWLFVVIFLLLSVELSLDILYFTNIHTDRPVSCCSVIFGEVGGANTLPLGLDTPKLIMLFYLLFALSILTIVTNMELLTIVATIFFGVVAYYGVVYFFGTYIYELPTHKCPFCMMQDHYYYVGYFVWGLLFLGLFFSIDSAIMSLWFKKSSKKLKRASVVLLSLFVVLCSSYVVVYYLKNGVFL